MDCSFVFSVFFIVLLLNAGPQVYGQNLTLCGDPLLSTRCALHCSREGKNASVILYKENTFKAECIADGDCTNTDYIYGVAVSSTTVKFVIIKLEYADRGNWKCESGKRIGEKKILQVYSFKDENLAMEIQPIAESRYNLTVKIECVMPDPQMIVKFCENQICKGEGTFYANGPCAYDIQTHRRFQCFLDFNFMRPRTCPGEGAEPIQLIVSIDGREVFNKKSTELFEYEKVEESPECLTSPPIYIIMLVIVLASLGLAILILIIILCKYVSLQHKFKESLKQLDNQVQDLSQKSGYISIANSVSLQSDLTRSKNEDERQKQEENIILLSGVEEENPDSWIPSERYIPVNGTDENRNTLRDTSSC